MQQEALEWMQSLGRAIDNKEDITHLIGFTDTAFSKAERYAYNFYSNGQYQKAQVLLEGLINMNKPRAYPFRLLADIAYKSRLYTEAKALWEKAEEYEPGDVWTNLKLAEVSLSTGRVAQARQALSVVLESDDPRADRLKQRALALSRFLDERVA